MYNLYTYYSVRIVQSQVIVYNLYYNFNMNERLKEIRLEKGLTIKDVCTALGLTISAYAHYEQGIREPSITMLKKICIFFGVSADYLIGLTDSY